jgi:hypothetical protein
MSNQNNDLNKNDDQEDQNYEDDNIEVIELNYDGEEDDEGISTRIEKKV